MAQHGDWAQENWYLPYERFQGSWIHNWEPRTKTASLFLFVFGLVVLESLPAVILGWGSVVAVAASLRLPAKVLWQRVKWVLPFVLFVFAGLVMGRGLDYLEDSLYLGTVVSVKALASIMALFVVVSSLSVEGFLQSLAQLRLPGPVIWVVFLAYRYLFAFREMMENMQRALVARGFHPGLDRRSLATLGTMTGVLFVKALDRSDAVYMAMLARGFDGNRVSPVEKARVPGVGDWAKVLAVVGVVLFLFWVDRGVV